MWMPDAQTVVQIHQRLVGLFEGQDDPISPSGVKSMDLLESGCSRPNVGSGVRDKYNTLCEKAAALFHSLTKNHAFHNGNKRTALVTLLTVLHRNDRRLCSSVTDDMLYHFTVAVTANAFPRPDHGLDSDSVVAEITSWIRTNSESLSGRMGAMRAVDFVDRCREAGATVKEGDGGGKIVITHGAQSIRIKKSTRKVDGGAVRKWLGILRMSGASSALSIDDFQEGAFEARGQIYRFMETLKRLAKT